AKTISRSTKRPSTPASRTAIGGRESSASSHRGSFTASCCTVGPTYNDSSKARFGGHSLSPRRPLVPQLVRGRETAASIAWPHHGNRSREHPQGQRARTRHRPANLHRVRPL